MASNEQYERLGAKTLSLVDVVAQSVGFMGPVFSAAFLIPLIAGLNATGKGAGLATPFAVILAAIGTFAMGWIVAEYAKRIHAAGSLYDYVTEAFGERIGFISGWVYYGGVIALTLAIGLAFGGFLHDTLFYNHGIDKEGSILDVGIECGAVEKKGAWLQFAGDLIGQGKDAAKKALVEKPDLAKKIVDAILAKRAAAVPAA